MNPLKAGEVKQHNNRGYLCVSVNGTKHYVHRLVCETFQKSISTDKEVNHLNGNKKDNRLINLEIVTRADNIRHAYKNSLAKGKPSESNSQAKLTNTEYYQIIEMIMSGYTNKNIAYKYSLNSRYISLIRNKKRLLTIWQKWEQNNYHPKIVPTSGGKSKYSYLKKLEIINSLSTMTNIEISKKYSIEASTVSRIRSKKIWKDIWNVYEEKVQRPVI